MRSIIRRNFQPIIFFSFFFLELLAKRFSINALSRVIIIIIRKLNEKGEETYLEKFFDRFFLKLVPCFWKSGGWVGAILSVD